MKDQSKTLLILGILVVAYAIFSRFYGKPSIAMNYFKSSNVLLLGNTILILSAIAKKK